MRIIIRLLKALFSPFTPLPIKKTIGESIQYPHEIFPEILKWEKEDELTDNGNRTRAFYKYQGVNSKGTVFYKYFDGTAYTCTIKQASRRFINCSLLNRNVADDRLSVKEYAQFVKDFQKAYYEVSQ